MSNPREVRRLLHVLLLNIAMVDDGPDRAKCRPHHTTQIWMVQQVVFTEDMPAVRYRVQVAGKVRDRIVVSPSASEDALRALALATKGARRWP